MNLPIFGRGRGAASGGPVVLRIAADPRVLERFPSYSAAVGHGGALLGGSSDPASDARLASAEAAARNAFARIPVQQHRHVRAWREAYGAFGSKPSKFLCSAEALLRRVLRGESLPRINRLVDLYNAVSLRHVIPAGGDDLDRVAGQLRLTFAEGAEPFDAGDASDPPYPGEVVWMDAEGITCRRWNWRQCRRTRLTEETVNAYFVLDRLAPHPVEALRAATAELLEGLAAISPGCALRTEWIGRTD
ncbi:MAG: B3/4 domain-containing protein [Thermoanaerobaculia bacterium]